MRKKIGLIFITLTLSLSCFSKGKYRDGEGQFLKIEGDSLVFVKKQLLSSAFKDIITKELNSMGHQPEMFWLKFDESFEKYFEHTKNKLQKAYGISAEHEVTDKKRNAYEHKLRYKRLLLKSKFGKLARVITSYSTTKMSRSPQIPNSRYLTISGKVDRKLLNEIFFKFMRRGVSRHFKKIHLTTNFNLKGLTWNQLGVEVEEDFISVVNEHWQKWMEERFKTVVDEVVIGTPERAEKLGEFIKIPKVAITGVQSQEKELKKSFVTGMFSIDDQFNNSLWVRINVSITKKDEDLEFKTRDFEFSGDMLIFDLVTNKMVSHFDFFKERVTYSFEKKQQLSSNCASLVYRLPMTELENFKTKIFHLPLNEKNFSMNMVGARTIEEVRIFKEFLQNIGITFSIRAKLQSFNKEVASFTVSYKGELDSVKKVLAQIDGKTLIDGRKINFLNEEGLPTITLVDYRDELENSENKIDNDQNLKAIKI